jgi:hypothetical protein
MMNNKTIMKRKQTAQLGILHGKEQATNQNIAVNVLPFHLPEGVCFYGSSKFTQAKGLLHSHPYTHLNFLQIILIGSALV